ncbi:hypothetical protein F8388_008333 [Cannabis sativa]|uniref:Reverse transcriptase zinc-binding domain-containing protein n=1 Tax=Cannabis sativa TaxID=3483 RepID=A0A7J6GMF9_CANSA|nr:hypothetical protein F8388_008333 [Cannabis sativa]KAF4383968.1 hypothetical protein G4B88_016401 [Cannabis sativa]
MKAKYFPRESFWSVSEKNSDSFVWKGILKVCSCVAEGACSVIVTGEHIDIWWQPWILWLAYDKFKSVMENVRGTAPYLLCVADLMYRNTRSWNHGFLRFLFGNDLGAKIGEIQIVKNGEEDFLVWKSSNTGQFSIKGAYWVAQSSRFNGINSMWSWIWKSSIHPRLSMMLWRVCANVLPTTNIFNPADACKCFFCDSCPENPSHLFVTCPFAMALWFGCPFPVRIDSIQVGSIAELLCKLCEGVDAELRCQMLGCFAIIFETIWNTRNRIFHDREASWSVDQARRDILNRYHELVSTSSRNLQSPVVTEAMEVSLNITSKNLIVVDGSFSGGLSGCAAIFLNRDSLNWCYSSAAGSCDSALAAEMEAVSRGIQWVKDTGWDDFTIASGSKILVDAICAKKLPDWQQADRWKVLFDNDNGK